MSSTRIVPIRKTHSCGPAHRVRNKSTTSCDAGYPYLTLKKRIIKTKVKDTPFAAMIGRLCRKKPYIIHSNKPTPMKINIKREISLVSFNFQVFINWGTNDDVVSTAAANPISVIPSNCILDIITHV